MYLKNKRRPVTMYGLHDCWGGRQLCGICCDFHYYYYYILVLFRGRDSFYLWRSSSFFFSFFKVSFCFLHILFSLNSFVPLCLVSYLFIYFLECLVVFVSVFTLKRDRKEVRGGLEASLQNGTHGFAPPAICTSYAGGSYSDSSSLGHQHWCCKNDGVWLPSRARS